MGKNPYYQGPMIPRPIPARTGPKMDIVRPGQGGTITGVCLSPRLVIFDLHYIDRTTVPCPGSDAGCPICQLGRTGAKPYGFVIAMMSQTHKQFVQEWTEHAMVTCPNLVALDGDLRGRWITVRRGRKSKRDKVTGEIGDCKTNHRIPDCPDIYAILGRIWGLDAEWCKQFPASPPGEKPPQNDPGDEIVM